LKANSGAIPTAYEIYYGAQWQSMQSREQAERDFFGNIRLSNGTYKFTYSNRLNTLNETLAKCLPSADTLEVIDVAGSSGVSALEWSESLTAAGVAHQMTVGDIHIHCFLVSFGRLLRVLVDETGYALQFDICGRAIANPPPRRKWWWALILLRIVEMLSKKAVRSQERTPHNSRVRYSFIKCQPLLLFSPRLLAVKHVRVIEDDVTRGDSKVGKFHVVRVANLLNRDYFDEATLQNVIRNLRDRLHVGGVLAACTTDNDIQCVDGQFIDVEEAHNNGTIFVLTKDDRLEITSRIGGGSPVESLILSTNATLDKVSID
jgi:hypothetical protein